MGSAQYTRDEGGKLLRKLKEIREGWGPCFPYLLHTTLAALDLIITEGLSPTPAALSLEDTPVVDETNQALRSMANGKPMGSDELPADLLELRL